MLDSSGGAVLRMIRPLAGCFAVYLALAAFSTAVAQEAQGYAPPREGNIYDHKAHQPTAADVCPEEPLRDPNCPSEATGREVEQEVEKLLRETDMDLQSGKQLLDDPRGQEVLPPRDRYLS